MVTRGKGSNDASSVVSVVWALDVFFKIYIHVFVTNSYLIVFI